MAKKSRRRPVRDEVRSRRQAKKRQQNLLFIGFGVALVALIGLVVYVNISGSAPVTGEESFASQGNSHIDFGSASPIEYNSTPPTSGPHYSGIAAWRVYNPYREVEPDEPVRYEQLVHNLEDGGVVIYYQCEEACPELVAQLEEVASPYIRAGRHVAVAPNDPNWTRNNSQPLHKDMNALIAATAWQKLLTLDEFDADMLRTFIDRYEGIDHHRPS
ncbi:MAG: DUF3105 domain-containing protein [Chloroflexota bacterium]